jgi:hypothetical protein
VNGITVRGLDADGLAGLYGSLSIRMVFCAERFDEFQQYAIDITQEPPATPGLTAIFARLTPGMLAELMLRMDVPE